LAELQRGPIDLILADYHLTDDMNGLEAIAHLRHNVAQLPPVVMITADGSSELKQQTRALGYPMLHKPIRPAALRALLSALVRKRATTVT
jgi:DNA-binding response OmpR family regulator